MLFRFCRQIDPNASQPGQTFTTSVQSPISSANLNNASVCTILKYLFYDDYNFASVKSFDNSFTNLSAYNTSDPNVLPIATSQRTINMPTGSLTRVLGTSVFLAGTSYYDEKGHVIQSLESNLKSGTDITTLQYHFDGRLLSSCSDHAAPGTAFNHFITLTKYEFDKIGRAIAIKKQYTGNPFKTIATYDYDDMGRLKTKALDPAYTRQLGQPILESLNYSYNVHNQITGINKDYALKQQSSYTAFDHFFGMYLGFDNRDNVFIKPQLNGQVTGLLWNTQGDDTQRKYDCTYDNAGRLINAAFTEQQNPGDGWSNTKMDFSVSGTSGKITYDLNGNLLTMLQKGVVPGTATPITVDDLRYSYAAYSNKLQSVTDLMTNTTQNGILGDFKDGTNGSNPDYVYDNNGNLVIDLNKNVKDLNSQVGAKGISYNFLDKPELIRIAGKGTIKIVYSADGEKLQRVYTPESGTVTTTTYINGFVYQASAGAAEDLAYFNFEEGRIRVITATSQNNGYDIFIESGNITLPNGKMGVYDYFIRDYQQNVRMVLTEEVHTATNTCTMETARSSTEDAIFGQTGGGNEVEATRYNTPSGWRSANTSASVSRLGNLAGHNIGPNVLQKVMAGDRVFVSSVYYYNPSTGGSNPNFVSTLLTSLGQALGSSTQAFIHNNAASITSQLNGSLPFKQAVQPTGSGTLPKAYTTVLFFDERFNLVSQSHGGVVQTQVDDVSNGSMSQFGLNVPAPKNGYVYAYVSNESDQDVYFDNFTVSITRGNILEENHYYAYGLKIAGLSSHAASDAGEGLVKNNYLYNDKELFDDGDLNWYDYGFRNYDPQIGRFVQQDPLKESYPSLTQYQYGNDDPINNIDLNGLEGVPANVSSFISGLGSGVENVSSRLMTAGKNIGGWAVRYTQNGIAYTHIFKAVVASTSQVGILATVKSLIIAELKIGEAFTRESQQFRNGVTEGVFDWAKDIVKSGASSVVTQFQIAKGMLFEPTKTKATILKSLILKKNQVLKAAYKIGGGDFSDINDKLIKFSQQDDYGVGHFVGNHAPDALLMATGGAEARAAGEMADGLAIMEKGVQEAVAKEGAESGTTLLGHAKDGYVQKAKEGGHNYFSATEGQYCQPANQLFLDQVIFKGDKVILTRPLGSILEGTILDWEVKYLLKNGYKQLNSTTLILK